MRNMIRVLASTLYIALIASTAQISTVHANSDEEVKLRDLKYGTILFDYYQQNYFASLIGYEVANSRGELNHQIDEARLLHGGMTLSYGLPDEAESIFQQLLNAKDKKEISEEINEEI
ncbi:MAG TPA: hypothetical protein DIC30_07570, partial [Oceanospirillales bacterium]|nr:hypothetical protein [Oceanospirillales bacterium]